MFARVEAFKLYPENFCKSVHILNLQVAVVLFCIEVYLIAPHVKKARCSVISDFHFEDLVYYILFTSKKYGKYKV